MRPGPTEIIIIAVLIILIFGWKKLPDAARSLGRSARVFKSEVDEMKKESEAAKSDASTTTVKGEPIEGFGIPESFRVLVKELQALGLSVEVTTASGERMQFGRGETVDVLPNLGFGLGFGPSS